MAIKKIRHMIQGNLPPRKLQQFISSSFKPRTLKRRIPGASDELAGGICGLWGCPLTYRGRTIKGCETLIQSDGRVKTTCYY